MSVRPEKCWSLWCDWPECDYQFEYGDFTIFGDGYDANEIATEADGRVSRDEQSHYCHHHPAFWASDFEDGEPFPAPPYLLIHDGDTEHRDDDGKVSFIGAADSEAAS